MILLALFSSLFFRSDPSGKYFLTHQKSKIHEKLFLLLFFFDFFCLQKKNKIECPDNPSTPITNDDYLPMTVGSSWIYETYQVNTDGSESNIDHSTTIQIKKDTVIENYEFKKFTRVDVYPGFPPSHGAFFLRKSLGELFDINDDILFSSINFTDTLRHLSGPSLQTFYKIEIPQNDIETNFGNLPCLNYKGFPFTLAGTPIDNSFNSYYAIGLGKVTFNEGIDLSGGYDEKGLIEYHIEPE